MSRIDENRNYVAMGVTDNASLTPTPLLVDPITNYLECEVVSGTIGGIAPTSLSIDENNNYVVMGVTNDANAEPRPLAFTTEGYLIVST